MVLAVIFAAANAGALDVPSYRSYVNDYGNMISPQMENRLEQYLASFDRSDSTQVAILTIPSLEGETLEDFSIRVVGQWKVGQQGRDNGILLLVSKADRKIRIEVGYGLEGVLTDLLSGRIIDAVITPYFKTGQLDQGFEAGVAAIIQATRGEFKADSSRRYGASGRAGEPSPLFKFLFFGIVAVIFIGSNSRLGGIISGGLLFPVAFLGGLLPSLGFALLLLVLVGSLGGWLLPLILANFFRSGGMGGFGGGGYYGGRRGGFGGGRGGGGFGGFGGGGFGGGGASGSW